MAKESYEQVERGEGVVEMEGASRFNATMLMIGVIMGTGVMGLPAALAKLGWIVGIGSLVMFGAFSTYSALLLAHTRNKHYPHVNSFADLATEIVGPRFGALTQVLIVSNWASLLPYYLMAAVSSIESASQALSSYPGLPQFHLCYWQWALVLMVFLLIPLQLKTLASLSRLAEVSDLAVVVAIGLMLTSFATGASNSEAVLERSLLSANATTLSTSLWPAPGVSFLEGYGSLSSFIFAFQGHSIFLEIMGQMKKPESFRKSVFAANAMMGVVYLLTCVIAYHFVGADVKGFLPFSLPKSHPRTKAFVGVLLCFHILVSYMLTAQPLTEYIHTKLSSKRRASVATTHTTIATSEDEGESQDTQKTSDTWASSLLWCFITLLLLGFAFFVANAVPFFSDMQNIIGSAIGAPILFGWPPFLYLMSERKNGDPLSMLYSRGDPNLERVHWGNKVTCYFFLYVMLPSCFILGLISAVSTLVADWETFGKPFDCVLAGY